MWNVSVLSPDHYLYIYLDQRERERERERELSKTKNILTKIETLKRVLCFLCRNKGRYKRILYRLYIFYNISIEHIQFTRTASGHYTPVTKRS